MLVSISTGELLLKESLVLLEKRKFRSEQWETALRIIIHRKPSNTSFKSTVETQLVTDSKKHKCECGRQSGVADEPGWEMFCWVSRAVTRGLLGGFQSLKMPPALRLTQAPSSRGWDSSAYPVHYQLYLQFHFYKTPITSRQTAQRAWPC